MEQHLLNCVPIWVVAYGQNFEVKMGGPSQSPGEKSPAMVLEILLKKLMLTTISRVCFGYKDISRKRKKQTRALQEYKAQTSWQIKILSLLQGSL